MSRSMKMGVGLAFVALAVGCDRREPTGPLVQAGAVMSSRGGEGMANRITVPMSLHATAAGMRYWYDQTGGFEAMTGAAYDGLTCAGCHVDEAEPASCSGCHDDPLQGRGTVRVETCLSCHARQASEIQLGIADVHRDAGLRCWDCHTSDEIHGDGTAYATMFEAGAMEVTCTRCHGVPSTAAHRHHSDRLACVACHMATSVTCVNCHFEKELEDRVRVAAGKVQGWQFLGRYRGQVYPLNFQSLEYRGNTFVAWGPYAGHTIVREGRGCPDCHASANVADLQDDGRMEVLRWDPLVSRLVPAQGVIPVPEDYRTALRIDFAALQPDGSRTFLESGPDASHMLFAEPLTALQLAALAIPRDEHEPVPGGPPLCDGVPATIWIGMDPALLPRGANITATGSDHDDHSHDDPGTHVDSTGTGDSDGGCGGAVRWTIVGSQDDDVIVGSTGPDSILGLGGNDLICALQARDHVHSGDGDDRVLGGPGADFLYGDRGDDFLEGGPGWDRIRAGDGDDWLFGNEGQDSLFGGPGDDFLFGGKSPDVLDGGAGYDVLIYGPETCDGAPGAGEGGGGGDHEDGACGEDHEDGGCEDHDDGGCTH
jgi:hypothetical protein